MNETYTEQLDRFFSSEENDSNNEKLLVDIANEVYWFTVVETVVIVAWMVAYVFILSRNL